MVGDCIMENGELIAGATLIVGTICMAAGLAPPDAAAAAAVLRFLRPRWPEFMAQFE